MSSYVNSPSAMEPALRLSLGLIALCGASLAGGWLVKRLMKALPGRPASRHIAAGLVVSLPVISLAIALTLSGHTYVGATAGSGAAVTYLLLLPAVLFGRTTGRSAGALPIEAAAEPTWRVLRRAVLPFSLATAAMWVIMGSTGRFQPLDGQFLVTLFLLGTWLFKLEHKAGESRADPGPAAATTGSRPDNRRSDWLTTLTWLLALGTVAAGLAAWGAALLAGTAAASRVAYLVPAAGALTCVGPILFAAKADPTARGNWGATLGYAAMAAACLAPGLAGFLQPTAGSPPLYGPDGAYLALAAGLVLALGEEGLAANRAGCRVLSGAWAVWLGWVLLSVLLAQDHVSTTQPADWSVWESA